MSTPTPYSERQRLEAAEWFADIYEAQDPTPEMLQRWVQWLEASEGNRLAFEAVERVWLAVPVAAHGSAGAAESRGEADYDASVPVAQWLREQSASSKRRNSFGQNLFVGIRQFAPRLTMAAAALGALFAVAWWGGDLNHFFVRPSSGLFATQAGEHMDLWLADGSRVTLGARSRLAVNYTMDARNVRLEAGEAFFSVHKDPHHPFRVHALDGVITAVGTAFNVRITGERVTAVVTQGTVRVEQAINDESSASPPLSLTSGEQLSFSRDAESSGLKNHKLVLVDPTQPVRWREGWLIYRNEPLRDVIADVARYTKREIAIGESVPADLRFTGAVFKDSVIEWVEALPEVFPVAIEPVGEGLEVTADAH